MKFTTGQKTDRQLLCEAIGILHVLGGALHSASLNSTPMLKRVSDWMGETKVGDLVVEVTTAFMRTEIDDQHRALYDSFGTLLAVGNEPVHSDSDWALVGDDFDGIRPMEKVYYVATMDGAVARWTNAKFVRVPRTYGEFSEAEGRPQP